MKTTTEFYIKELETGFHWMFWKMIKLENVKHNTTSKMIEDLYMIDEFYRMEKSINEQKRYYQRKGLLHL
jgi:hypothetical protein